MMTAINDNVPTPTELHPTRNYLLLLGATLLLAIAAMHAARAECNCNGGTDVRGNPSDSQGNNTPSLSREEIARWNTVGIYYWSKQSLTGQFWNTIAPCDCWNTWGAINAWRGSSTAKSMQGPGGVGGQGGTA